MKVLLSVLLVLTFLFSCSEKQKGFENLPQLNIEMKIPSNHTIIDEKGYEELMTKLKVPNFNEQMEKLKEYSEIPKKSLLQDTTNIKNIIVVFETSKIVLSKKNISEFKKRTKSIVKSKYPQDAIIEEIESKVTSGTYLYGKFKYKITHEENYVSSTYYILNLPKRNINFMIQNEMGLDYEEIISKIK